MFGIGPIELLIVGSIALVMLASIVTLVVVISQAARGRGASSERSRIEELEAENRSLKNELDRRRSMEVYPRSP